MGMKTTLTSRKAKITHFGVNIGLQAGSSCCVNLEYLGRLEILLVAELSADPGAPELDEGALELITRISSSQKSKLQISGRCFFGSIKLWKN